MRDKWTKSRDEAAKKDEELIVVKALLKQKEVSLQQALEVSTLRSLIQGEALIRVDWKS